MRLLVAALFCCSVLPLSLANGEQAFPYKTCIAADDVYVRSGPGQNYYPTNKLKRGDEVEVYRHDPGGWCAIRPVDGSFTWVSSRFLKPTEDNLAVITEDGVQARVGSQFSDIRDVVQVRLQKGEVVEAAGSAAAQSRPGRERLGEDCPAVGRVPLDFQQISRRRLSARRRATWRRWLEEVPTDRRTMKRPTCRAVRPRRSFLPRQPPTATTTRSARDRRGRGRFRPTSFRPNWIASSWNCR